MIVLPKGAVAVKIDKPKESIIIGVEPEPVDIGEIVYTSEELNKYQTCKIKFRHTYAEPVNIEGKEFLYLRDLESSMYYIIAD